MAQQTHKQSSNGVDGGDDGTKLYLNAFASMSHTVCA